MSVIRIALIGPSGSGKTSWITRLETGEFQRTHLVKQNYSAVFITNGNNLANRIVEIFDISDMDSTDALPTPNGIIIMLDEKIASALLFEYAAYTRNAPTIIVQNKIDLDVNINSVPVKQYAKQINAESCMMSVKSCYNYSKPIALLLATLVPTMTDFRCLDPISSLNISIDRYYENENDDPVEDSRVR